MAWVMMAMAVLVVVHPPTGDSPTDKANENNKIKTETQRNQNNKGSARVDRVAVFKYVEGAWSDMEGAWREHGVNMV